MTVRRTFLATGAAVVASTTQTVAAQPVPSSQAKIRVGVMGLSRGLALAKDLQQLENVEVSYLCDVDQGRLEQGATSFHQKTGASSRTVTDFREILADSEIDALVCAAPNHWHGPATIMACKAGKHVYVEKPCSHNPLEGEWMIEAAEKYGKCVQMGTQRRSAAGTREAIQKLHDGVIGNVHLSRAYYNNLRGSIGTGKTGDPPPALEYQLWEGPAPHQPYRSTYVHYNWHWHWHYGGGELANNGVHALDLCRWGLDAEYPTRVTSSGGRYWFDDDQETPDVHSVCFEFEGGKQATWDALSCNKHRVGFFAAFYGDRGTLELDTDGVYRIFDRNDKPVEIQDAPAASGGQKEHLQNFVDAIRSDDPTMLQQPITEGHRSTLLCHLGNIAHRTGRTVNCDPRTGHILEDQEQQALWRREYAPEWEEAVSM